MRGVRAFLVIVAAVVIGCTSSSEPATIDASDKCDYPLFCGWACDDGAVRRTHRSNPCGFDDCYEVDAEPFRCPSAKCATEKSYDEDAGPESVCTPAPDAGSDTATEG